MNPKSAKSSAGAKIKIALLILIAFVFILTPASWAVSDRERDTIVHASYKMPKSGAVSKVKPGTTSNVNFKIIIPCLVVVMFLLALIVFFSRRRAAMR